MAHKIAGQRAAFTGKREDVWHGIGIYLGDRDVRGAEIIADILSTREWDQPRFRDRKKVT